MKPQETKFTFVYNEIKQCILEGQIPPGSALPSSRMYCGQFHVSRYTINRVFDALRAEGLVDIRPRLAPIVVSKKDTCNSSNTVFEIFKTKGKHFTGISDFCTNTAFTYGFCFAGV